MNPTRAHKIADLLLSAGCLQVSPHKPFLYASGLKGPLYCDNRKILGHPDDWSLVIEEMLEVLRSLPDFDQLAGLATAGIPHAAVCASRLGVPLCYLRSSPKSHGKGNQVEGDTKPGDRLVLIEDLVNQGKSLGQAVEGALEQQLIPVACVCIVDYQMIEAQNVSRKYRVPIISLTNFEILLTVCKNKQLIDDAGERLLRNWQRNPLNWLPE